MLYNLLLPTNEDIHEGKFYITLRKNSWFVISQTMHSGVSVRSMDEYCFQSINRGLVPEIPKTGDQTRACEASPQGSNIYSLRIQRSKVFLCKVFFLKQAAAEVSPV